VTQIHDLTVTELAAAIRGGQLSPVEITDHYLDRTDRLGGQVGAFYTVTRDRARQEAAAAEKAVAEARRAERSTLPPLAGVPIPIKDLNLVAGVRVTFGSLLFQDNIADQDDYVVAALRGAGIVITGKTATPEFGLPCYTETRIGPPARTPWDVTRSAGGSSGGAAAAVAAGLAPAAQGSDGGGSIRIPSSVCGLFGIKPTRGRVSHGPLIPDLSGLSIDGPLARTVADAALLLDAMTGNRHGDIMRFFGPDHTRHEIFAHVGGQPLGLAFDREGNLDVCIGGMGLYQITPERKLNKLSDETNRTLFSVVDDSRLRLADDLDIAADGRVFFSEATIRFEMHEWPVDALESRGNGRIICFDPKTGKSHTEISNLIFPNGICMLPDGESFFFAETFGCRVSRYYYAGPKKGRLDIVIDNMPGYPDNINRASDGNYWLAIVGMRSPALDLALRMPGFRRRMARRCAPDAWMYPNLNTGCVIKFNEKGEVLESLWDLGGKNHPMITSIREHKGVLYLGGIYNNRIGTYEIPGADPNWCALDTYWGRP